MNWGNLIGGIKNILNARIFNLGDASINLGTILIVILILITTAIISRLLRRGLRRVFLRQGDKDQGNIRAILRLLHYAILLIGTGIALQTAGIDLTALFAAGAVFAVGIGFAMQNIVQNFVSGVILLVERAIKPGDILEVEGRIVKVLTMGIRATIVLTRNGENLIVPNASLVQSTVKNYTFKDSVYRLRAPVGVSYGSDMKVVKETLQEVGQSMAWRLKDHEPMVLLTEFGDNSVNFELSVWMSDPWIARPSLSEINRAIWWAFKERDIVIAFPQLDVHFDPSVVKGLNRDIHSAQAVN